MDPTHLKHLLRVGGRSATAIAATLALGIASAVLGCEDRTQLSEVHYAVYSTVLTHVLQDQDLATTATGPDDEVAAGAVVISAQLDEEAPHFVGLGLRQNLESLAEATAADYQVAPVGILLEPKIKAIGKYELVDPKELLARMEGGGWRALDRQYPGSLGVYLPSRIGFNETRTQALVFVTEYHSTESQDGIWGQGVWYLVESVEDKWTVRRTVRAWVS